MNLSFSWARTLVTQWCWHSSLEVVPPISVVEKLYPSKYCIVQSSFVRKMVLVLCNRKRCSMAHGDWFEIWKCLGWVDTLDVGGKLFKLSYFWDWCGVILMDAFPSFFGIAWAKEASMADYTCNHNSSVYCDVMFIRSCHDWELGILQSIFCSSIFRRY